MGGDTGEKDFPELLYRIHGQNQRGGWKQRREGDLAGVVGSSEGKIQTTVIEQQ